jgi:hypothetical protein
MPDLDLPPENYREKGREPFGQRVRHASKGLLFIAVLLAVWAAAVIVFQDQMFPGQARVWAYVIGLGPFALFWLWFALFDA